MKQLNKKVFIKNHPNPKLKITKKLKVEYVQIAYDNRYIVIKQNKFGTMWHEIVKVSDLELGKIFIEALIKDIKDNKKQKLILNKLITFWNKIEEYDEVLEFDAENEVTKN